MASHLNLRSLQGKSLPRVLAPIGWASEHGPLTQADSESSTEQGFGHETAKSATALSPSSEVAQVVGEEESEVPKHVLEIEAWRGVRVLLPTPQRCVWFQSF